MRELIARLITIPATYSDVRGRRQIQRLLTLNLIWLAVTVLAMPLVFWWLIEHRIGGGSISILVSFFLAVATHRFIQSGQIRWARWAFVANIAMLTMVATFSHYRLDAPLIILLTLPVTAAGVLLHRSELVSTTLMIVILVILGGLLQISADMEPTPIGDLTESIRSTLLVFVVVIGFNVGLLWMFLAGTEDTLQQQSKLTGLFAVTGKLSQTLLDMPAPGLELNQAVEQFRDALDLYHAQVYLTQPSSGLAVLRASTGYVGRRLLEEDSLSTPGEDSPVNDALRRKDPLIILHTDSESKRSGFLPATQNQILIPLRVKGYLPFGVLDLHSTERQAFSPEIVQALVIVGNQLAVALHSVQQAESLEASLDERDSLLAQIADSRRELAKINRQIVGTTWGTYLSDRERAAPGFEWREGVVGPAQTESDMLRQVLKDGQPRLERHDDTDMLCVPIRLRGQVLGAVEFRRSKEQEKWSETALDLVQAITERLALALENARLFEQAQNTAQREQLVNQITSDLQTSTELHMLLNRAAVQFQQALGAAHTRVRLGLPEDSVDTVLADDEA